MLYLDSFNTLKILDCYLLLQDYSKEQHELTPRQYKTLFYIDCYQDQALNAQSIADGLGVTIDLVYKMIEVFSKRHLIVRTSPKDGKRPIIQLSSTGKDIIKDIRYHLIKLLEGLQIS